MVLSDTLSTGSAAEVDIYPIEREFLITTEGMQMRPDSVVTPQQVISPFGRNVKISPLELNNSTQNFCNTIQLLSVDCSEKLSYVLLIIVRIQVCA